MTRLRFELHAAGVLAPGLASLADLRVACNCGMPSGERTPLALPSPAKLPANERRRASQAVRLTMACIEQALSVCSLPAETMRSVFATDEGTGDACQQMMEALATTRQVSPLVFPNSVHNAPSGYFAIGWHNRQSATVASLGLESFACGLLCAVTEAAASRLPVLLVAYDVALTSPIDELLSVTEPTATAWILSTGRARTGIPALGSFTLDLGPRGSALPTPLPSWQPPQWAANSSAHALAALGLLEASPDTALQLTLGRQILSLQCVGGGIE